MPQPQRFFSDNAAPVHPRVIDAVLAANAGDAAYDGDALSARLDAAFSDLFETRCTILWAATGTAANCLILGQWARSFDAIVCHPEAHIEIDECGAPALFTGGAKLVHVGRPGDGGIMLADALVARLDAIRPDVHQVQPAAVSITNATEWGRAWTPDAVAAIADVTRRRALRLHMDGARFANAVAHVGCAPADVTWRAGVDALAMGFVKNGGMNAEAVVFFGDAAVDAAHRLRKRSGHLMSKGRFLAAQLLAMLDGDLWLANARAANAAAAVIADAAGGRLIQPVEANELFIRLTSAEADTLRAGGFDFYDWGDGAARLVTSWHHMPSDVAPLADALRALGPESGTVPPHADAHAADPGP